MFVHWALDKRAPVRPKRAQPNQSPSASPEPPRFFSGTFTVETWKLILLVLVNFIRHGLLHKTNFPSVPEADGGRQGAPWAPPGPAQPGAFWCGASTPGSGPGLRGVELRDRGATPSRDPRPPRERGHQLHIGLGFFFVFVSFSPIIYLFYPPNKELKPVEMQ